MARAKSSSTATPTHNFTPKFKRGDVCVLRKMKTLNLNGLVVTILSDIQAVKGDDQSHEMWLGYETDFCYRGAWVYPSEDSLAKIGEVAL